MAKIVVACEDEVVRATLCAEIDGERHEVLDVYDGYEAYQRTLDDQPDLVILDAVLPVFSGLETCDMIRADPEIAAELPIIFLLSEDTNIRTLEKAGATDYLPRAHGIHELRDLLAKYLPPDSMPPPVS